MKTQKEAKAPKKRKSKQIYEGVKQALQDKCNKMIEEVDKLLSEDDSVELVKSK